MANNPTTAHRRYWAWVANQGCLKCGEEANIHHLHHELCCEGIEKRISRDHWKVTPLCKKHHQDSREGIHGLGSNWKFYIKHGINLVEEAQILFDNYHKSH